MIIKILWGMITLNTLALIIAILYFFAETADRNLREQEGGWTFIIFFICVVIILLAAVPLRLSHSNFAIYFSAFFAFLPLGIWLYNVAAEKLPSFQKQKTMAKFYYDDKTQQAIAGAVEKCDTTLLKELIKGQDLNIQGVRVNDWNGLNYLQFAIHLRCSQNFTADPGASDAVIRILTENGSESTRALAEAVGSLPLDMIEFLLDSGADPNTYGYAYAHPLLFSAIGSSKRNVDEAILLVRKGARTDKINKENQTPLMYAAQNSSNSAYWFETWRFIRFLLEEKHVDYTYTNSSGNSFPQIIEDIKVKAEKEKTAMPADFIAVMEWLKKDQQAK